MRFTDRNTDRNTDRQQSWDQVGALRWPQLPRSSACLLDTVEQRGGDRIQLNMEAGLLYRDKQGGGVTPYN